jgi:hypothetical protein
MEVSEKLGLQGDYPDHLALVHYCILKFQSLIAIA